MGEGEPVTGSQQRYRRALRVMRVQEMVAKAELADADRQRAELERQVADRVAGSEVMFRLGGSLGDLADRSVRRLGQERLEVLGAQKAAMGEMLAATRRTEVVEERVATGRRQDARLLEAAQIEEMVLGRLWRTE